MGRANLESPFAADFRTTLVRPREAAGGGVARARLPIYSRVRRVPAGIRRAWGPAQAYTAGDS
jgi:hypothetical protein